MTNQSDLMKMISLCQEQIKEIEVQAQKIPTQVIGLESWIKKLSFCTQDKGFKLLMDRDSGAAFWIRPEEG